MRDDTGDRKRGAVLVLVGVGLVALSGFTALAIDVGTIMVARAECQSVADAAALAGARALDGSKVPDLKKATDMAVNIACRNTILGKAVKPEEVEVAHGSYHYDPSQEKFYPQFPPQPPDSYTLSQVTVRRTSPTHFARVLGFRSFATTATATAAHRPRDVSIVLDFSGSMNNESDLWNNESYLGSMNNSPNNTDPVFPKFGHYSDTTNAKLQCTTSDSRVGKCNITRSALGVPAIVNDFYAHGRGSTVTPAFDSAGFENTNYYAASNVGDRWLKTSQNTSTSFARHVAEIFGGNTSRNARFETSGYESTDLYASTPPSFQGFTRGPSYWGKSFFIWPPDPRSGWDWRSRFFLKPGGSYPDFGGPVNDNTALWDSSGNWYDPNGRYVINYRAILAWIKATPCPFPSQLRAGRILYYDEIPDDVPTTAYDHTRANNQITNQNQRFWKEYIDFTLGVWRDPFGNIQGPGKPACSYGPDFSWGTIRISAKPTGTDPCYMNYLDNPKRPRHRFWFGPMTMVQFMMDTGVLPGTAHDISMYPAKLGITGALMDIKNNHPNDLVSLIIFCRPQFDNDPDGMGAFSQAVFSLSRDYEAMIDGLWYPPDSEVEDARPYDERGRLVPRAYGDFTSNTATHHGFLLAYNQFNSSSALRNEAVGGLGRRGASRLVVLETDGMANVNTSMTYAFVRGAPGHSYYPVLPGDPIRSKSYNETELLGVVRRICADQYDNTVGPGFSTSGHPVRIHTVAFGPIFEPTAAGTDRTNAVSLLQKISTIGSTSFPSTDSDPENGYKWCIGTLEERKTKLREAFRRIMDDGVSPNLVK